MIQRPERETRTEFTSITDLSELEGTYSNLGYSSHGIQRSSKLIWPEKDAAFHRDIVKISVVKISVNTLKVTGQNIDSKAVVDQEFAEPQDFHIEGDRVILLNSGKFEFSIGQVIGVGYTAREIGIGSDGNGKVRESSVALGWFIIPAGVIGYEDIKFEKNK